MSDDRREWKRKDISDEMVIAACINSRRDAGGQPRTIDFLVEATGAPEILCYRAMERALRRGLIEYGVSLGTAWPTDRGFHYWIDCHQE